MVAVLRLMVAVLRLMVAVRREIVTGGEGVSHEASLRRGKRAGYG
jgi:hypothetical protein